MMKQTERKNKQMKTLIIGRVMQREPQKMVVLRRS
jgi:hypothetical protein